MHFDPEKNHKFNMANLKSNRILAILLISALFLEGCASIPTQREFKEMFSPYLSRIDDNPIILIPGIIGSRLVNVETGRTVWGSLTSTRIQFLPDHDDGTLPIDKLPLKENIDNVKPKGIIYRYDLPITVMEFTVYREILDMFKEIGYKLGDIKNPKPENNLYVFDYDWRRDNVENVIILAQRIENIKRLTGRPDQKFNLICHSMGGLIGRYYMRYGDADVLDQSPSFNVTYEGAENIKKLILIGVPNLGTMSVFRFLHKGLNLAITKYPPYYVFTMPSMYQLLPSRRINAFVDKNGKPMDVDLYDVENWKKFGWSIYSKKMIEHTKARYKSKFKETGEQEFKKFEEKRDRFVKAALERADLFQESLSFRPSKRNPCEIVLFGGDTEWTLNKAILKKDRHGNWQTCFRGAHLNKQILVPGDNIVTRESFLGVPVVGITRKGWLASPMDISFSLFVTQKHENIHKDPTFQDNLLHILLGDYIVMD